MNSGEYFALGTFICFAIVVAIFAILGRINLSSSEKKYHANSKTSTAKKLLHRGIPRQCSRRQ